MYLPDLPVGELDELLPRDLGPRLELHERNHFFPIGVVRLSDHAGDHHIRGPGQHILDVGVDVEASPDDQVLLPGR